MTAIYTKTVENLGEVTPDRRGPRVEEKDDAAIATLSWSWPVGPDGEEWTYESQAELARSADDTWQVTWNAQWSSPASRTARCSTSLPSPPGAATSPAPTGWRWSPPARWSGWASTRRRSKAGWRTRPGPWPSWWTSTWRRTSRWRRPPATWRSWRRSSTAQDEVPAAVTSGYDQIQGGLLVSDDLPARPDPRLRGADPRHGRRGHGRDDQGAPGRLRDRRRGRAVRAPAALRRAAPGQRRARWSTPSRPTAGSASCSGSTARKGKPLKTDHGPRPPGRGGVAARRRRPGQCAGRDPPQRRRDPRGRQRPRHQRLQHGDVRAVRSGLDVQERQQPGPAAGRARAGRDRLVHADHRGRREELQELLRLPVQWDRPDPVPHRPRQLLQHRLHLRARPARRPRPGRRGRRAGHGHRPRPRLPGVLRQRRAARDRDREGGRHDRPGQGPGLADGDGDRDRVGAAGRSSWCPGCCSRSRSRRPTTRR